MVTIQAIVNVEAGCFTRYHLVSPRAFDSVFLVGLD